jgi:host factor-I protein
MMTSGNAPQLQFLAQLRDESIPVSVYLKNGIRLQGQIESFDEFVISLRSATVLVVYKNAICSIVPARNFAVAELAADAPTPTHSSRPLGAQKSPSMLRRVNQ